MSLHSGTREETIKRWMPEIERLLRGAARDCISGLPVLKKISLDHLADYAENAFLRDAWGVNVHHNVAIPLCVREYVVDQWNRLMDYHLDRAAKSKEQNEVQKTEGFDPDFTKIQTPNQLEEHIGDDIHAVN